MRQLPMNQFLVLDALARPGAELSVSQLADAIPSLGKSSTYAAITKLQKDGRIRARLDVSPTGQPWRVFEITAIGRKAWDEAYQRMGATGLNLVPKGART